MENNTNRMAIPRAQTVHAAAQIEPIHAIPHMSCTDRATDGEYDGVALLQRNDLRARSSIMGHSGLLSP